MSQLEGRVDAVDGVAIINIKSNRNIQQFTVVPTGSNNSGTGSVYYMPRHLEEYEQLTDANGDNLAIDMTAQLTYAVNGGLRYIKVESSSSSDEFELVVS